MGFIGVHGADLAGAVSDHMHMATGTGHLLWKSWRL